MFGLLSVTNCSQKPTADSANDATAAKQLPNIIYVLADDMGYGDLSSYGQKTLSTPNIDQLASEGIKLTKHYTGSTVCAPSRATLLTGAHTGHVSVRGNQPDQLLRDEDITIAVSLFWIHTEFIRKLPKPIEYIFVTPSHHRVHHAVNDKYLDKNYGSTLVIWDRMFGTFQPEEEEPIYGITKPVKSFNPIYLVFHEWMDIFRDIRKSRSFRKSFKILFGRP